MMSPCPVHRSRADDMSGFEAVRSRFALADRHPSGRHTPGVMADIAILPFVMRRGVRRGRLGDASPAKPPPEAFGPAASAGDSISVALRTRAAAVMIIVFM